MQISFHLFWQTSDGGRMEIGHFVRWWISASQQSQEDEDQEEELLS